MRSIDGNECISDKTDFTDLIMWRNYYENDKTKYLREGSTRREMTNKEIVTHT